jgi:hypothetical protein
MALSKLIAAKPHTLPPPHAPLPPNAQALYLGYHFDDVQRHVNCDQPLPVGKTVLHSSGIGDLQTHNTSRDVSGYTMFAPPAPSERYQLAVANNDEGSVMQAYGNTVGMWLNTTHAPDHSAFKVMQWAHCWRNDFYPWAGNASATLCADFEAAIPFSQTTGNAINYAYMAIAVRDCATQTIFWVQNSCYDSRGDLMRVEGLVWWAEQHSVIALGFYGGQRYCTPLAHTHHLQGKCWREWRHFGSSISGKQLLAMICEANQRFNLHCSGNLDQYRLELIGVGPEICARQPASGKMAMKVRNLRVLCMKN